MNFHKQLNDLLDGPLEPDHGLRWCFGGKGGGGTNETITSGTTTTTSLPEYAEPYMTRLMQRGEEISNREYEPYDQQRIAELNEMQESGFEAIGGLGETYGDAYDQGEATINSAAGDAYSNYGAQTYDPSRADPYFNQYLDRVLDTQQSRMTDRFQEQRAEREGQAAQAGAFGGSRHGIQDFLSQREENRQFNEMENQTLAQGFDRAHQLGMGAAQFDEGSMARETQLGLAASELRGRLGGAQAGLGTMRHERAMEDINAQLAGGGQRRALEQENLDQAYRDFANQRDYERGQATFMGSILHGVPISPVSEVQQYENPNQLNQLLGLGIGGLAMYRNLTS
jgi:hypothetical protein